MNEPIHNNERPPVPNVTIQEGITPFFFPSTRGRLVRLSSLTHSLLERHHYPEIISRLGGEALTLVAALSSALKFEGSFSLQIKGEGAVSMLIADCTHEGALRFYIKFDEETLKQLPEIASAKTLFGKGLFALTIDQLDKKDTYQGVVEITGETLSDMAVHYFNSSEQFPCWIRLCCEHTEQGWRAAGIILEKIANDNSIVLRDTPKNDEEEWNTLTILAETVKPEELLDETITPERLLYRLFNSIPFTVGQSKPVSYGCRCSRSRLKKVLDNFSNDDLESMQENGKITMTCEFCRYDFVFKKEALKNT